MATVACGYSSCVNFSLIYPSAKLSKVRLSAQPAFKRPRKSLLLDMEKQIEYTTDYTYTAISISCTSDRLLMSCMKYLKRKTCYIMIL